MHGFWRAALYAAALGILAHPVGQALPRRWFDPYQAPYRCRDWEQGGRVYNKLHIRRWKDRLPDMSRLMPDMVKKKLAAAGHIVLNPATAPEGLRPVDYMRLCFAMMEAADVIEELKARDPMRWVGLMNTLKAQAEEIIFQELIST